MSTYRLKPLYLAMYKGPAHGFLRQLWHRLVCWVTVSNYSHCELVLDYVPQGFSLCASSSTRDGGVRANLIDLQSGRWDVYPLGQSWGGARDGAEHWFIEHKGEGYDYLALLYFLIAVNLGGKRRWFCSEACAAALGLVKPWKHSPQSLLEAVAP